MKTKVNKQFLIIIGVIFTMMFLSCEKENSSTKKADNSELKNGILEFQDNEELSQTINEISKMSDEEYAVWQAGKSFVSLRTKLDDIYRQLNNEELVNSEDKVNKIINDNKNLIELVIDEFGEQCIYPIVQDLDYTSVLNTDGICIVGDNVLKIIGDYKVTATKSEIFKLINTRTFEEAKTNNNWEIVRYAFPISKELKSTNECELRGSYTYNPSGCINDRRVFIQMVLVHDYYGHIISLRTRLTSEKKLALTCIWVHYWTEMEARNVSCYAKCYGYGTQQWYYGSIEPFGFESGGDVWQSQRTHELFRFTDSNPTCAAAEFINAHGEATSRGVGANWAIINYSD